MDLTEFPWGWTSLVTPDKHDYIAGYNAEKHKKAILKENDLDVVIGNHTSVRPKAVTTPDPENGYFLYKNKVYERRWMPRDKKWTVYDATQSAIDPQTNLEIYEAANNASKVYTSPDAIKITTSNQASIPYDTFVKYNLGSLTSRRNWVGENADYLRSKGWSDPDIEGYKGLALTPEQRAALNKKLATVIEGADAWYELQRTADQSLVKELPKTLTLTVPASASPDRELIKRNAVDINNMDAVRALSLPRDLWELWLANYRLRFLKQGGKINYGKIFK